MSKKFWQAFNQQDFADAEGELDKLPSEAKQTIIAELFQKSSYHRKPMLVSVLTRELAEGMAFKDFYQSWFPSADMCDPLETRGQVFQQHFPAAVRVVNAVNINNPKQIVSVGITWVKDAQEEQGMWDYLAQASAGENEGNETRQERIEQVADGNLLGLFKVETDDNLGTPF